MRIIDPLVAIAASVIFLVVLVLVAITVFDVATICDDKNLQTCEVIITNKFIENRGIHGDSYYFLDEDGIDYQIWGGHEGARYVKLKMNQSYQIKVNVKMGNFSCKEVLM